MGVLTFEVTNPSELGGRIRTTLNLTGLVRVFRIRRFVLLAAVQVLNATFASAAHQPGQSLEGRLPENYSRGLGPASTLLEMVGDGIRNEPPAQSIHVPVTVAALLMGIETLRDNQMKMVFRPGHCDAPSTGLNTRV
jgi:hypothetical protein